MSHLAGFVGQAAAIRDLRAVAERGLQLLIFDGDIGSGRKRLAQWYAEELLGADFVLIDEYKIEAIREIESVAVLSTRKTCYVFVRGSELTVSAQNAALKFFEEPPKNAHIIILTSALEDLLPTIRSRAGHILFTAYSDDELRAFTDDEYLLRICRTPGKIIQYKDLDAERIYKFAEKVIDNIHKITGPNVFRILSTLQEGEYDIFIDAMKAVYRDRMKKEKPLDELARLHVQFSHFTKAIDLLTRRPSINKKNFLEITLFKIREVTRQCYSEN